MTTDDIFGNVTCSSGLAMQHHKQHGREPQSRLFVEIQLNDNTLEARHRLIDGFGFCIQEGEADSDAGWRRVVAFPAHGVSNDEIEARKAEAIHNSRTFWLTLIEQQQGCSIIADGSHYTSHELGVGIGFYGEVFRVEWLDTSRPALVCNLSTQGKIPGWLRPQCPDNATISNLDYLIKERPVISRRRTKRRLMAAGLRPAEAGAFLRMLDDRHHYSRQSYYWPSRSLIALMKHGKRHAVRWFPQNIYID